MILYIVGMWYIFYVDCDVLLDVVDIDFEGFVNNNLKIILKFFVF